jgi:Tfp pilus assembly PilM family ATPase
MLLVRDKGLIGVDVGTHTVKLAQVERRGAHYALVEAVVVQRPEPWNDVSTQAHLLQESGEEIVAARTLGTRFLGSRAASVLPMAVCQLKSMQVADGSLAERREAIAKEIVTVGSPGVGSREFDFWPIDSALESSTITRENVSVLSIDAQWPALLAREHQQARLQCEALDGVPLALGRAVAMCPRADQSRPVAVLDWGFTRATFCVVLQGRPLFVRCLRDCEYGRVVRALRDSLTLTWDEARHMATEHLAYGGAESTSTQLHELVSEVALETVSQLVVELQRTMTYLKTHRAKLVPEQMWLFGGGASARGIDEYLMRRLDMKFDCWDLGGATFDSESAGACPVVMLGPAVALSALAWEGV